MKRIREISIGTVISFLLMTGCMQTTVKPAPQALAKQAEKKTAASPAAVQSEPKKADSMGNAGGKSDVKVAAEIQLAKHRKSSTNREAIERSQQFRAEYEKAEDKLV